MLFSLTSVLDHAYLRHMPDAYAGADALGIGKSAYIRYVVPTPDDQEATVEYDLDEEDEEWLQKHNSHVSRSCLHMDCLHLHSPPMQCATEPVTHCLRYVIGVRTSSFFQILN